MIKYIKGNLLEAEEDIIGHQTNCRGAFGAGLAGQIRSRYPSVYHEYKTKCALNEAEELLGKVQFIEIYEGKHVANLFSQLDYGREKKVYTQYPALREALTELREVAEEQGLSVALPFGLGSGLAGGDWKIVSKMIEEVFDGHEVTIYKFE